ncbi:MAG: SDR family oxidoreductase [Rhodospirillales bacterium]|nr:SDR family oxidoreductase [Rhodospirillales bacterium]
MPTKSLPIAFQLTGHIAFVSGAAGHLGSAMTKALLEHGAHVIANGRSSEHLEQLSASLQEYKEQLSIKTFDVTDEKKLFSCFEEIHKKHGRLDILINNAYAGSAGTIATSTGDDFSKAYNIGVIAAFNSVKAARPGLAAAARITGSASVINIASMYASVSPDPKIYAETGLNNPPFYGAAKCGLLQLTRYLACNLATEGIRVNAISPGPFPPDKVGVEHPEFLHELTMRVPMGRLGKPEDLSGAILFLASQAASYITGVNLPIDGGWTAW